MTINDVIDYVMHTPENPNPAVLRDMLLQMEGSSEITEDYLYTIEGTFSASYDGADYLYSVLNVDETMLSQLYSDDQQFVLILKDPNNNIQGVIMTPVDSLDTLESPYGDEPVIGFMGTYLYNQSGTPISLDIVCTGYFDEIDEELYYEWVAILQFG